MKINVMSWNMAGAKVFGNLEDRPRLAAQTYVEHFHSAWKDGIQPHFSPPPNPPHPDLILLQEGTFGSIVWPALSVWGNLI